MSAVERAASGSFFCGNDNKNNSNNDINEHPTHASLKTEKMMIIIVST